MGTVMAGRESELRSVSATINYTRPIAERLHIDVRDFSRTNMQFEPHTMKPEYHIVSHHQNNPDAMLKYAKINGYHLSLFGDFVEKLRTTRDGSGSLLDHSLIMYGSAMGNGNIHDQTRIPIMLAGHAGGRVQGGRHSANPNPTPMANLIATLGEVAGVDLGGPLEHATGRVAL